MCASVSACFAAFFILRFGAAVPVSRTFALSSEYAVNSGVFLSGGEVGLDFVIKVANINQDFLDIALCASTKSGWQYRVSFRI